MKWLGILFVAVLLVIAPGYGRAQQQKGTAPATQTQGPAVKSAPARTAASFTPEERKAYEKKTADELDAIQKKIADVKMEGAAGSPQNKRLMIQASKNLQLQKMYAASELKTLEKTSGSAWGPQQAKVEKAMEGLRKAFESTATPGK
jgi:hypothetical protein